MALIFVPTHNARFETLAGSEIIYEVDILRSYDENAQTPSWLTDPVVQMTLIEGDPLETSWAKSRDFYKPRTGSTTKLTIVVEDDSQVPDFVGITRFEYQMRIRREVVTSAETTSEFLQGVTDDGGSSTSLSLVTTSFVNEGQILYRQGNNALSAGSAWSDVSFFETQTTGSDDILDGVADGAPILVYGDDSNYAIYTVNTSTISNDDRATVVSLVSGVGTIPSTATLYLTTGDRDVSTFAPSDGFETSLIPVWCGFISSVEGEESITDPPFEYTISATDGMSLLGDITLPPPTSSDPVVIFDQVLGSLIETGLGIPVYVDSKILHTDTSGMVDVTSDALTIVTSRPDAIYTDDENTDIISRRDQIDGFLPAFRCKVLQSASAFYILNTSLHGGTGDRETTQWLEFRTNSDGDAYELQSEMFEEDLLYTVTNDRSTRDLHPAYEDLIRNPEDPYGSVECRPENLIPINFAPNGCLTMGTDGFAAHADSVDQTLSNVSAPRGQNGEQAPKDRALTTNRSRFDLGETNDVWFETDLMTMEPTAPIDVSFNFLLDILKGSGGDGVDNARFNWSLIAQLDASSVHEFSNPDTYSNALNVNGTYFETINSTTNFHWNFDDQEWIPGMPFDDGNKEATHGGISTHEVSYTDETDDDNSDSLTENWISVSEKADAVNVQDAAASRVINIRNARIKIVVWYPTGKKTSGKRNRGNRTGTIQTYFTNLKIENDFDNDVTSPVFERTQEGTDTLVYRPRYVDGTSVAIRQRILEEGFHREGNTAEAALPTTLERIGTQLTLNDWGDLFEYVEGTFVNNNTTPFQPHNKLSLDWGVYSLPRTLIFSGGTWRYRSNEFDIQAYMPNQTRDVSPLEGLISNDGVISRHGFFPHNVNLVPAPFPGRSNKVAYRLALVIDGLNDQGGALQAPDLMGRNGTGASGTDTPDTGYVATTDSLEPDTGFEVLTVVGEPGEPFERTIKLIERDGFDATASAMDWFQNRGSSNELGFFTAASLGEDDVPGSIDEVTFTDTSTGVDINIKGVLPPRSEFEQLHAAGEVDVIVEGDQRVTVNFTATVGGVTQSIPSFSTVGPINSRVQVTAYLNANTGKMINVTSTSPSHGTLPAGLLFAARSSFFTGAIMTFTALITETEATYDVTLTANESDLPVGVSRNTHTINLSEFTAYTNASITPTQIIYSGEVGDTEDLQVFAAPASGNELFAADWSITDVSGVINDSTAVQNGYGVIIPTRITVPAVGTAVTSTTVNGTDGTPIGVDTFTNTLTIAAPHQTTYTQSGATISQTIIHRGVERTTKNLQFDWDAVEGNQFTASDNLTFTLAGSGLVSTGNSLVGNSILENVVMTIGSSNQTSSITPSGDGTSVEPYSVKFILNNVGLDGVNVVNSSGNPIGDFDLGYDSDDFGDAITDQVFYLVPKGSASFTNINEITSSDNNTSETISNDYDTNVALISTALTNIPVGSASVSVTGLYPSVGGDHVVTIDIGAQPSGLFVNGEDAFNRAELYVYQIATASATPAGMSTVTFSTGNFTPTPTGWFQTIPTATAGQEVWRSTGFAVANSATDQFNWEASELFIRIGVDGEAGSNGDSAYQQWLDAGNSGSIAVFLDSLVGDDGDSAYQTYVDTTDDDPVLTQSQWIDSLNGIQGDSAYEIYRALTDDDPPLTEEAWLNSLDGPEGDSAYQIYVENFVGEDVPDWRDSGFDLRSSNPTSGNNFIVLSALQGAGSDFQIGVELTNSFGGEVLATVAAISTNQFVQVNVGGVTGWSASDDVWIVTTATTQPLSQEDWIASLRGADGRNSEFLIIYSRAETIPAFTDTVVTFDAEGNASWNAPTGWYRNVSEIPDDATGALWQSTETAGQIGAGTDTVTWDEGYSVVDETRAMEIATSAANTAVGGLNVPEPVQTFPVRISTGNSLSPYVYQYLDGNSMTRTGQLFAPDSITICVAGASQSAARANASFTSNPDDSTSSTGSSISDGGGINCEIGSTDSTTARLAQNSLALGGSIAFFVTTAPTSGSSDGLYLIEQTTT